MQAISNRILIGDMNSPDFVFENTEIQSINEETAVSLIGDELFIDQLVPIVGYTVFIRYVFKPTNYDGIKTSDGYIFCTHYVEDIRRLPYGTKVTYYSNNVIAGVYYIKNVERVGKSLYKLNCVSAVGLMARQQHKGGIYTGQSFSDVVAEILGTDYTYEIDNDVATQKVYGWLPYSTKRQNLYQLVMAYGVQIVKSSSGNMRFTFLTADETPSVIPKSRLFYGGSVSYTEPASRIEVIEHGYHYASNVEEETLLDNPSDYVDHIVVKFDRPVYPDSIHASEESADSLTIHERGINYAIVSGVGVLLGKPYIHSAKLISLDNPEEVDEKIVTVDNATLVTLVNGDNVLERLGQYYFNAMHTNQDINLNGEVCGGRYQMWNTYQESMIGFITKMSIRSTSIRRAQCEIVENYLPVGAGAAYTQRQQIDLEDGHYVGWVIPEGVKRVRVVLIGYGENGENGEDGEDGEWAEGATPPKGGKGGAGGRHGDGAKVFGQTVYTDGLSQLWIYSHNHSSFCELIPQEDDNPPGQHVTFSSENGASSPTGYYDEMTGDLYALPGYDGIAGGAGGAGGVWRTRMIDSSEELIPNAESSSTTTGEIYVPFALQWEQGTIETSGGTAFVSELKIRTDLFYSVDGASSFKFDVPAGFAVYVYGYSAASESTYTGTITRGFVTGSNSYSINSTVKFIRFVCEYTSETAITPSDAPDIHAELVFTQGRGVEERGMDEIRGMAGSDGIDMDDDQFEWREAEPGEDVIGRNGVVRHGGAGNRTTEPYYDTITLVPNDTHSSEVWQVGTMIWHRHSFYTPLETGLPSGNIWTFCGVGGGGGACADGNGSAGTGKVLIPLDPDDFRWGWQAPYPGYGSPFTMELVDMGGNGASPASADYADPRPGCGGNGGDGGGGGGGAGVSSWYNVPYNTMIFQGQGIFDLLGGKGGKGGRGGNGSAGQHGCAIIYY